MGIYSDKLWAACQLINEYNSQLTETILPEGVKPRKTIDSEKFLEKLVVFGGVSDEMLKHCSWEDLEHCGLPRLLARKVAAVFRCADVPAQLLEHSIAARKWLPVLKKWNVSWRDYIGLVEKLEQEAKRWTEDNADSLSERNLGMILENIRDQYYEEQANGEQISSLPSE